MGFGMSQLGQKSEGKADIVRPEWCRELEHKRTMPRNTCKKDSRPKSFMASNPTGLWYLRKT